MQLYLFRTLDSFGVSSNISPEVSACQLGYRYDWLQCTECLSQAVGRNKLYFAAVVHNCVLDQKSEAELFEILLSFTSLFSFMSTFHFFLFASCSKFSVLLPLIFSLFSVELLFFFYLFIK